MGTIRRNDRQGNSRDKEHGHLKTIDDLRIERVALFMKTGRPKHGIATLGKMIARPKHGIATLGKMIARPKRWSAILGKQKLLKHWIM
ncbi:MAG: hypothetical protein ACI4VB_02415 [Bradymonadia bacterium]